MNQITEIRSVLGLNQQELSEILGISRSMLAMVEKSERKLSGAAIVKLGQLELKFSRSNQKNLLRDQVVVSDEFNGFILQKLSDYQKQTEKLTAQLKILEDGYQLAMKKIGILNDELEMFHGVTQYEVRISKLILKAQQECERFHPEKQKRIQYELMEFGTLIHLASGQLKTTQK